MDKAELGLSSTLLWDDLVAACAKYKYEAKPFYRQPFYHFLQVFA